MAGAPIIRGFSFGEVVSGSFAVLFRNLIPFLFFALLLSVPSLLFDIYVPQEPREGFGFTWRDAAATVIDVVCATLTTATLVFGTVQELRGQHASLGASIRHGFSVILPAIGVGLIVGIGIGIGMVLLIIPGLILTTMWWVAVPVTVVERPGVFASLGRSVELTRGYRWPIFGIILLFAFVSFLVLFVLGLLLAPGLMRGTLDPLWFYLIVWGIAGLISAYVSVLAGVGYFALRVQKEGADIDQLATVFE